MTWPGVAALANIVVAASYLAISIAIARGLWRSQQWRRNRLGMATAAIFFTSAVGHGLYVVDLPSPGGSASHHGAEPAGQAVFGTYFDRAVWDALTAAVGVWYWTLRGRFPALVRGAAVFEDLILRQAAEQTLRENEELFRGIVETTVEGVVLVDQEGRISYANAQFAAMVGRRSGRELLGTPLAALAVAHDAARVRLGLSQVRDGGARRFEVVLCGADSQPVSAQVALSPRVDVEGGVEGALAMVANVTEQKNVEEQLRQVQRLDAVGQLAGGVAHDFNNLMTVIDGYAAMLLLADADGSGRRNDLNEIRDAAARATALTRQVLAFSRGQAAQPQVVNVNDLVLGIDDMLHRVIREDVDLVVAAAAEPAAVWANRGQLEQVLLNLAVNSRDAMPRGGLLAIRTDYVGLDAEAAAWVGVAPGGHVVVTAADTGTGMADDVKARVFEPFFTTKEPGKGTGLGLSTAYGIVRQANGNIVVESEQGVGSTFRVYLPVVADGEVEPQHDPKPVQLAHGTETILLVEDDDAVRELTERILRTAGYQVLAATGGHDALSFAQTHPAVDLLLTDVVMPRMNGRQLADRLTAVVPGLPVLFVSAYTRGVVTGRQDDPAVAFLDKPFTAAALAGKVRDVLDSRAGRPPVLPTPDLPGLHPPDRRRTKAVSRPPSDGLAGGTETILLAEDDHAVRELTERMLRDAGYRVLLAAGGREAISLAGEHHGVGLLLTDVVMPRMNGRQLADRLTAVVPGLPVLFVSAYTRGVVTGRQDDPAVAFLDKPFTAAALAGKVRDVLDSRAGRPPVLPTPDLPGLHPPDRRRTKAVSRPPSDGLAGGTETILLAEDDHAVRELTERMLRDAGYRVLLAAGGREAISLAGEHHGVGLLLTDVVMPRMNGRQLADRLTAVVPGLPVLFVSAYTRGVVTGRQDDPAVAFLDKPFTAAALAGKVRDVLDSRAGRPPVLPTPDLPGLHPPDRRRTKAVSQLPSDGLAGGTETILLAEDDHAVRELTERMLRDAGYRVLLAAGGREAISLAGEHHGVGLLLTDVVMPRMNGRQLADRLTAVVPGLPVLFVSAYTRGVVTGRQDDPAVAFLDKPFTAAALTGKVRDVLDSREVAVHADEERVEVGEEPAGGRLAD